VSRSLVTFHPVLRSGRSNDERLTSADGSVRTSPIRFRKGKNVEPIALHATLSLVKIKQLKKEISTNVGDDTNATRWDDITSKYVQGGDIVKHQSELIDADMCEAAEL
jgi:hypothetical protein